MRELSVNEIEQVSGGWTDVFLTGGALTSYIFGSYTLGAFMGGYATGTAINNNLSYDTRDAIGYTTHTILTEPIQATRNAYYFYTN